MTKPKDETRNDQPHTDGEASRRVTAETMVTDGPSGFRRMVSAMRHLLDPAESGQEDAKPPKS